MTQSHKRSKHELRCICRYRPLLAVYGNDAGKLYIHIKVYKGDRLYGEVVITEGRVQIHCRDCYRWHKIKIASPNRAVLEEDKSPPFLSHDS